MIKKYHDPIFKLISEREEALGVNEIAKGTELPLSTIQKYLSTQQSYFRKNEDRKWDLPEKVMSDITDSSLLLAVNVLENSILLMKSQVEEVEQSLTNLLTPISTLKRGINDKPPPVADKTYKVNNEKLDIILNQTNKLPELIKSKKVNLTDEYLKLLLNTKWLDLVLDMGNNYVKEIIESELYSLLLGDKDTLSEDALSTIKEYQEEK